MPVGSATALIVWRSSRGVLLLEHRLLGGLQALGDLVQLVGAVGLNAEVIELGGAGAVEIAKLTRGSSSIHLA
jgi:hypothetical protein